MKYINGIIALIFVWAAICAASPIKSNVDASVDNLLGERDKRQMKAETVAAQPEVKFLGGLAGIGPLQSLASQQVGSQLPNLLTGLNGISHLSEYNNVLMNPGGLYAGAQGFGGLGGGLGGLNGGLGGIPGAALAGGMGYAGMGLAYPEQLGGGIYGAGIEGAGYRLSPQYAQYGQLGALGGYAGLQGGLANAQGLQFQLQQQYTPGLIPGMYPQMGYAAGFQG